MTTLGFTDDINVPFKEEKCKICGKLAYNRSEVPFHPPENNPYCSCPKELTISHGKCEQCGKKLDTTLYQTGTKSPSYSGDNSSPELCENCKRTNDMKTQKSILTNSNGSSWVTCSYCSVKLLDRNLEKHEQNCQNYPNARISKQLGTQNQIIKRLEIKIQKLESQEKEREDKINTLQEQIEQLSKTCAFWAKAATFYSEQSKTMGRVEISEMKNLEFVPNDSSFSGRILPDTFRNNNKSTEMSSTQPKSAHGNSCPSMK